MAKTLKTIGIIAGVVALAATGLGLAIPAIAATAATVASVATVVAGVSNLGAAALTKPPPARGSVTDVIVEVDPPMPYGMGEGYLGGVMRHRVGYGATLKKVPNPYLAEVTVHSHGGPIEGPITPYFDFDEVGSWYSSFFDHDSQLGACPEAAALVPPYGTAPGWTAAHKLSGQAAILWNHKFDKDGKRYANGLPVRGAYAKWVRVYDPRQDDTFPGGSGPCRLGDESTYVWDGPSGATIPAGELPALHAGTYAYGRYQNGKRVLGMGLSAEAIDWTAIAAWANDCEANEWRIFGRIFEPADRWANLKDICAAGGGIQLPLHAGIGFHWDRPRVVLDTITDADLAGEVEITSMQSWRDRINTIVPRFISPAHSWELITADPIAVASYLAEDGEARTETWPFNLVKNGAQAGQLATYKVVNSRELFPITIPCKPRLRAYRPGDCLNAQLYLGEEDLVLDTPVVILTRDVDPKTFQVTLTVISETAAKHAFALGQTATPPPTPTIGQTAQERDELAAAALAPTSAARTLVSRSVNYPLSSDDDSIDVLAFDGVTDNGLTIAFPAATLGSLTADTDYVVLWNIVSETYAAVAWPAETEMGDSDNVYIGRQITSSGGVYSAPEPPPPGYCVADNTPILLADGSEVPAADLAIGAVLRTQHERTLAWGDYPVAAISFSVEPVFACSVGGATIRATADHLFLIGSRWVRAETIGTPDGTARVAKITVAEAHTYVSAGQLSHNEKAESSL